jgi:hypothetical protein
MIRFVKTKIFVKNSFINYKLAFLFLWLVFSGTACAQTQSSSSGATPTITPIPYWQKLSSDYFEIWLPDNYLGGTNQNLDEATKEIAELGPDFARMTEAIKLNKASLVAFAIDPRKNDRGIITNMVVTQETISGNFSIEEYVDSVLENLSDQYQVTQREILPSARYSTEAVIFKWTNPQTGEITQIMYAMKNGGSYWQITFSTASSEFQERLPVFQQIANSTSLPYVPEISTQQDKSFSVKLGVGLIILAILLSFLKGRKKGEKIDKMPITQKPLIKKPKRK